jgi:hypothetical protein
MTAAVASSAAELLADLLQRVNNPSAAKVVLPLPQLLPALQALLNTPSTRPAGFLLLQQLVKLLGFYGTAAKSHTAGDLVLLMGTAVVQASHSLCHQYDKGSSGRVHGVKGSNSLAGLDSAANWQLPMQVLVELFQEEPRLTLASGSLSAELVPAVLGLLEWLSTQDQDAADVDKPSIKVANPTGKQSAGTSPAAAIKLEEVVERTCSFGGNGKQWEGAQAAGWQGRLTCLQLLKVLLASSHTACEAFHDLLVTKADLLKPWVRLQQQVLANSEGHAADESRGAGKSMIGNRQEATAIKLGVPCHAAATTVKEGADGGWAGQVHQALLGCVCSMAAYLSTLPIWPPPEPVCSLDTGPGVSAQQAAAPVDTTSPVKVSSTSSIVTGAEDQVPPMKEVSSTWSTSSIFGRRTTKPSHAQIECQANGLKSKGKESSIF